MSRSKIFCNQLLCALFCTGIKKDLKNIDHLLLLYGVAQDVKHFVKLFD